jgi:hypothetical protein
MDYRQAVPVVQQLTGIKDLGSAVRFYEEHKDLIKRVVSFFSGLLGHHENPAVLPPPLPVVLEAAPKPVVVAPPTPGAQEAPPEPDDIKVLRVKLLFVERPVRSIASGQRGVGDDILEDHARFDEILQGANIDDGSWLHTDCSPFGFDGTEIATGDPRWAFVNRAAWPNGNPIFPYYEWNGHLTSILHGDVGSPEVNPGSFEDNEGCTVTYKLDGKGTFRFGYLARRRDGTLVDSGLIGQGNVVGGAPFNVV